MHHGKISKSLIVLIILSFVSLIFIPFSERVLPKELINEFGLIVTLVPFLIPLFFLISIIILKSVKEYEKHDNPLKDKKSKDKKKRNLPLVVKNKGDIEKQKEIIQKQLENTEKNFLKNKISEDTFHNISREKTAELIKLESMLDKKVFENIPKKDKNILENISNDKKRVLNNLLKQKQGKYMEMKIAENKYLKRKLSEVNYRRLITEIENEIVSINEKIKDIQKTDTIEKLKAQLSDGAKEINRQKNKTNKRKKVLSEEELFEKEVFDQLDL